MEFDKGVWQVKTPIASRELDLFNVQSGKVAKANDGLSGGDEGLCKVTYHRR